MVLKYSMSDKSELDELVALSQNETSPPSYETPSESQPEEAQPEEAQPEEAQPEEAQPESLMDNFSRIMDAPDFTPNEQSLIFQLSFYSDNSELFLVVKSDTEKEEKFQILSDDQKMFDLLAEKITKSVETLYKIFPKKADYKKQKKFLKKALKTK